MRDKLRKIIEKWEEETDMHRSVIDSHNFDESERKKASHYAHVISSILIDLRKLETFCIKGG